MTMQKLTFENSEEKIIKNTLRNVPISYSERFVTFQKFGDQICHHQEKKLLVRTKNLNTCQPIITQSYYVKPILTLNQFWHDMHYKFWHIYVFNILANVKSNTVDLKATLEYKFIDKSQKYMFEKILS